jgi:hypothetical protein
VFFFVNIDIGNYVRFFNEILLIFHILRNKLNLSYLYYIYYLIYSQLNICVYTLIYICTIIYNCTRFSMDKRFFISFIYNSYYFKGNGKEEENDRD